MPAAVLRCLASSAEDSELTITQPMLEKTMASTVRATMTSMRPKPASP